MDIEETKIRNSKSIDLRLHKIGEVIETGSAGFTAQCYKLEQAPPLGGLVKTQDELYQIYGVVYNIETHGLEPGRRVAIRGENLENESEIFSDNPQLYRLLATDFHVVVAGYVDGPGCHQYLPPKAAPIHGFVYTCQPEEISEFTESLDFLSLIMNAKISVPVDEVVAACLRQVSATQRDRDAFLVKAGRELAGMLSNDVSRLNLLLKRLK